MIPGQNRTQVGRLLLIIMLWLMLFVLAVKILAAWVTRSLSLMAESLQTLLISFSTFMSLLMTDADQPRGQSIYGHGKRETALTFVLIAVLGFIGLNVLVLSSQQLASLTQGEMPIFPVRVNLPLLQLLGIVALANLGLALLGVYQARVLSHLALRFNAGQLLKDALLTLLVLAGLLGVWWGLVWFDALLAILLVLLTAASCWNIVNWQLPLMVQQTAIAPEVLAQIVRQVGGVTHCYHIQSRGIVGRLVHVQMHLIMHPEFTQVTSLVAEHIEKAIQERYGPVQVTFYIDESITESMPLPSSPMTPEVNSQNNSTSEED